MTVVPAGSVASVIFVLVLVAWIMVLWAYRSSLARLWHEPVLRCPVLIVESDDWGPGPAGHAEALRRVCSVLARHQDATSRPAHMTVGVVLGVPDNEAIRASAYRNYSRKTLGDPEYGAMRKALTEGRRQGVLSLQLHGLEHLWPPAFMKAVGDPNGEVRRWVDSQDGTATELLPSPIQSRWIDASVLPSVPLAPAVIEGAVRDEVGEYEHLLGERPRVIVPPTFVWNEIVERAWHANGLDVLITPGRRLTGRDAKGVPNGVDRTFLNGDVAAGGLICLVRDVYFEPVYGHASQRAVSDTVDRFRLGRPALIETHRFNFIGARESVDASLHALDTMLSEALKRLPTLRIMAAVELADAYRRRDASLIVSEWFVRIPVWLRRASQLGRLRKLAWLTGLVVPASLIRLCCEFIKGRSVASRGNAL